MRGWLAVLAVAAGSYAFRLGPLLAADRPRLVATLERALRFAGPAAASALAVKAVRAQTVGVDPADGLAALAAIVVGGALAIRRVPVAVVAVTGLALQFAFRAAARQVL
jgi:branched-subunit amino acid transport protein